MREQNFGIEVELTGITRNRAAKAVAEYFNTTAEHYGGIYDEYRVQNQTGRTWKLMSDASIRTTRGNERVDNKLYSVELVSPICKYEDIPDIQEIVRQLRHAGAVTNSSCGVHVHINAAPHTAVF